jgi:transcriptional regulator with XRE-family HTH domain
MPRPQKPIDTSTFRGQIAARIRERRSKLKLTGEQAAERAGVPVQTWYHWEQGYRLPLDELPRIAQALKTKPRKLLPE